RLVPLTPSVQESLLELSKVRSLSTNHVFLYEGKPIVRIKRAFQNAVRRAKIENFRFHDLRHCAATNLRRAGVDTITAMKIVGHKSERMHRRYNTVSEGDLLSAVSKVNTYLTPTNSDNSTSVVNR
ncbi:MAG: site-specific integrase, partial [Nitrospirales bacterium]